MMHSNYSLGGTAMNRFQKATLGAAAICLLGSAALAQAPAAAPASPPPPLAIPNPTYSALVLELAVAKPAAEVWSKIGDYCGPSKFLGAECKIIAGKSGDLGAVRLLNGTVVEVLVAKSDLSYTYTQPTRVGQPYNLYHASLAVVPVTVTTSKLTYSFLYDNSMLADDAARAAERTARSTRFGGALQKMKDIAEAK
jgi:hypothetical protein